MLNFLSSSLFVVAILASINPGDLVSIGEGRSKDDRVVDWHFGNVIEPGNKSIYFEVRFFVPTKPGTYQVILYFTGLDGFAESILYTDFCTKLVVATNSIVVAFDTIRYPSLPDKEERMFADTVDWTLLHLNDLVQGPNTPKIIKDLVFPDIKSPNGVTLMGHSASGHPVTGYLVNKCDFVKSLVLLDPVDGYDPFGFIKIFITDPPKPLDFVIPTLLITTGYDSDAPSDHGHMSCAPANMSNERFYTCMPGPTWMLNFTQYGHADILDDWTLPLVEHICKTCPKDCNRPLYRTNVVNSIAYFLKGVQDRDPKYIDALENPAKSGLFDNSIEIVSTFKHNSFDVTKTGPFCSRYPN